MSIPSTIEDARAQIDDLRAQLEHLDRYSDVDQHEQLFKEITSLLQIVHDEQARIPCAPWCVQHQDNVGCNGSACWEPSENHRYLVTGTPPRPDENGDLRYSEVRIMPSRVIRDEDRHDGLAPSDSHIVQITIEPEGWLCDNWVGMTIAQARQVRDALSEIIGKCEADEHVLATAEIEIAS
jgi:hypothetical protein